MTIHLPADLQRYVLGQVHSGRFASADDVIAEAVRLLQQQEADHRPLTEDEWERQLMEAGMLQSQRPNGNQAPAGQDYPPVPIEGELLSETVIRERR